MLARTAAGRWRGSIAAAAPAARVAGAGRGRHRPAAPVLRGCSRWRRSAAGCCGGRRASRCERGRSCRYSSGAAHRRLGSVERRRAARGARHTPGAARCGLRAPVRAGALAGDSRVSADCARHCRCISRRAAGAGRMGARRRSWVAWVTPWRRRFLAEIRHRAEQALLDELALHLDLIALAMEAGSSLTSALTACAERAPDGPLRRCWSRAVLEIHAGTPPQDVLRELEQRIGLRPFSTLVMALRMAERAGVSAAVVLRERARQAAAAALRTRRAAGTRGAAQALGDPDVVHRALHAAGAGVSAGAAAGAAGGLTAC